MTTCATQTASGREVLTIQQVADITGLATKTLYNLRYLEEGPPMWPLRGRLRCFRDDLDAWIAEQAGTQNLVPLQQGA